MSPGQQPTPPAERPAATLVTGGFGFIGSHLLRALTARGGRAVVIDRLVDGNAVDEVLDQDARRQVDTVQGDLADPAVLREAMSAFGVDSVVHLAAMIGAESDADPGQTVVKSVGAFLELLDAARAAGVRRVVWASSTLVFGDVADHRPGPIADDAAHRPRTIYGATKAACEAIAEYHRNAFGTDVLGLRFNLVLGPGRQRGLGLATLVNRVDTDGPVLVEYADDPVGWQYVDDAVAWILAALDVEGAHQATYNTSAAVATPRELAALIGALVPGARFEYRLGRLGLPASVDASRGQKDLRVPGDTELSEILRRTFEATGALRS